MWSIDTVKAYCINLDKRTDRWERMIEQPEIKRIPSLKRFSGIDGSTLNIATDTRISTLCRYNILNHTRRSHDLLDSAGGVGCALSHITLWQNLLKSHDNVCLVVEDDLVLNSGDWEKVRGLFKRTEWLQQADKWDIWSIGNLRCWAGPNKPFPKDRVKEDKWLFCKEFVGFNSYFISRRGAERLLKEAFPIQHHIDWYTGFYADTHPDFKIAYNKLINLDQDEAFGGKELSDIRTTDVCKICDIPSDVEQSHLVLKKNIAENLAYTIVGAGIMVATVLSLRKYRII
jgi:GR25 family glycosyltransferase involved in LPS biosynthesis